jgi:multidrug efflux pump subunit AcrA (membrane-fusion protein)
VQVGELHDAQVEILDGLQPGDQVIAQGAILLKPLIVEATQKTSAPGAGER